MTSSAFSPTVLVIGDVMLDIVVAPERAIEFATDTPARIKLLPGGSGANLAACLGYFGNHVVFAGRAGHVTAEEHAAALRAHGVEPLIAHDDWAPTGTAVTLIGAAGERSFLTDRAANARLVRSDLPDALLDRVALIHVSGYALLLPGPRAAVGDFLAQATERGIPYSVDAASAGFLRDVGPAAFLAWTRAATICFANADEAELLTQCADFDEQLAQLGALYATAIVTRGAAGAGAVTDAGMRYWSVPAERVSPLDTTGAGDAFVAGFLTAHLRGQPFEGCLQTGVRAGTAAVMRYGGRPPGCHATTPAEPV